MATGDGSKFYRVKKVVEILTDRAQKNSAREKEPADPETVAILRESKIERAHRRGRLEELKIEELRQKQGIANGELSLWPMSKRGFFQSLDGSANSLIGWDDASERREATPGGRFTR